jgi:UDP-N-acetylglucosamine diphosphorylase / glucose-1-phosphate thymidylyltransferase / UDP-N-acetylgalactosamine diphosphorylase / glucosamine-1-phosphate N-acetyltransferase / galactosamine-1-phosphate N-acetyltransferase
MVYIYEDELYQNFLPLVNLHPVFSLYCGRLTLYEKVKKYYPNEDVCLLTRPLLKEITEEKYSDTKVNQINNTDNISLYISARAILTQKINIRGKEETFINKDGDVIGFRARNSKVKVTLINTKSILKLNLSRKQVNAVCVKYLWDLIELNHQELISDFSGSAIYGKINKKAVVIGNTKKVYLGHNAEIEPAVVIDVRKGPVYIDDNAKILASSKIIGPAYIGKNSVVDMAKINSGTTIGENCRISGEIEASILHGFINKHHYGFIGHSYIGEWVNLGAGTTNSDLKNNYSTVKVRVDNKEIDSEQMKVGCFIGDHAKTAIGTMIPTGAVIGIFANVLESSKLIPNFFWSKGKRWQIGQALNTANAVMMRRNKVLTKAEESLIRKLYKTE